MVLYSFAPVYDLPQQQYLEISQGTGPLKILWNIRHISSNVCYKVLQGDSQLGVTFSSLVYSSRYYHMYLQFILFILQFLLLGCGIYKITEMCI